MNLQFIINITWDTSFFAILPAININLHSKTLEFEWTCLGIYIDWIPKNKMV